MPKALGIQNLSEPEPRPAVHSGSVANNNDGHSKFKVHRVSSSYMSMTLPASYHLRDGKNIYLLSLCPTSLQTGLAIKVPLFAASWLSIRTALQPVLSAPDNAC